MNIGVFGDGSTTRKATVALLDDAYGNERNTFLIPATVPYWTDPVRFVADWALDHQQEIIFFADSHDLVDLDDFASPVIMEADDVVSALATAEAVLVAWPDSDTAMVDDVATRILRQGTKVFDLIDGLWPVTDDSTQEAPVEPPSEAADMIESVPECDDTQETPEIAVETTEPDEAQATVTRFYGNTNDNVIAALHQQVVYSNPVAQFSQEDRAALVEELVTEVLARIKAAL